MIISFLAPVKTTEKIKEPDVNYSLLPDVVSAAACYNADKSQAAVILNIKTGDESAVQEAIAAAGVSTITPNADLETQFSGYTALYNGMSNPQAPAWLK